MQRLCKPPLARYTKPLPTANEAGGLQDLFLPLLLAPEIGEGVDDHPENEVQDDDDDNEIEQQVIDHTSREQGLLQKGKRRSHELGSKLR